MYFYVPEVRFGAARKPFRMRWLSNRGTCAADTHANQVGESKELCTMVCSVMMGSAMVIGAMVSVAMVSDVLVSGWYGEWVVW